MHGCCHTEILNYSAAVLPRSRCGRHLASRRNVSHILHLSPCHAQAVHGRREECLAWPECHTAIHADGARVRDALHTVMVSGNRAYERLVWQLGFTVVEVHAWLQLAIHMHATSLLQTRDGQEAAADAEAVQNPISFWSIGSRLLLQVRMSPDNMTAFILWDAHDDCLTSAEREVSHRCAQCSRACCTTACFTPTGAGWTSVELLAQQGSQGAQHESGSSRTLKLLRAWGPCTSSDEVADP